MPFNVKYHRLFSISLNQDDTVQDLWTPNPKKGSGPLIGDVICLYGRTIFYWSYWRIWKVLCVPMRRIGGDGFWRRMVTFR